MAGVQKALTSA